MLAETGAVRRELGWPVMATPLSQLVGTQAVLNVVTGQRYGMVPDEVVAYAAGHYGEPPGADRPAGARPDHGLAAARRRSARTRRSSRRSRSCAPATAPARDDDLLILKALIPERDIDAMQAAGPVRRDYPLASPEIAEVRALMAAHAHAVRARRDGGVGARAAAHVTNRAFRLRRRPAGEPARRATSSSSRSRCRPIADGEALVRTLLLSVDPGEPASG